MTTRRIKLQYTRDSLPGRITLVATTPDGSRISQSMAPGDVVVLDLNESTFVTDEELAATKPQQTRGEAYYARALLLAPGAGTDDLIRLADFLSEHPEPAS